MIGLLVMVSCVSVAQAPGGPGCLQCESAVVPCGIVAAGVEVTELTPDNAPDCGAAQVIVPLGGSFSFENFEVPAFSETKSIYTIGSMTSNNIMGEDEDTPGRPPSDMQRTVSLHLPSKQPRVWGQWLREACYLFLSKVSLELSGYQALEDLAHSRSTRMLPPIFISALILCFLL